MKRMILITVVSLLAGWEKEAKATLAEIYFPLNVGNSWTYTNYLGEPGGPRPRDSRPVPEIELTFTIIGTEEIDGHTFYKFDNFFSIFPPPPDNDEIISVKNVFFTLDTDTNRILTYRSTGDNAIRYDFVSGEWDSIWYGWCRLKQSDVSCGIPAGEFSDCINFQFGKTSGGPKEYMYGEYLAPNVGLIKYVIPGGETSEGSRVTFQLKSYTIVPEPNTLLLLGLGTLLLIRRK
jgi:hypothetical protein